jgi:hypothetical protein
LRPLAGQGWSEFFERAGNYGVPIAILVVVGFGRPWLARLPDTWSGLDASARTRLIWTLRITTACLLAGHAGCALLLEKPALADHYEIFGVADTAAMMATVGWFEAGLAVAVLASRSAAIPVFVCVWKVASESLVFTSGGAAPLFELVERGGSYVAPLALAWMLRKKSEMPRPFAAQVA